MKRSKQAAQSPSEQQQLDDAPLTLRQQVRLQHIRQHALKAFDQAAPEPVSLTQRALFWYLRHSLHMKRRTLLLGCAMLASTSLWLSDAFWTDDDSADAPALIQDMANEGLWSSQLASLQ